MNFFEQQDLAYRNTKRLIVLLCLAVLSLIAVTTFFCAAVFYYMEQNTHNYLANAGLWQGITHAMSWQMLGGISFSVCAVIFLGSLYKLFQLSSGGRVVAESLGGRPLTVHNANADEKKILNVVEEMSIASGTPVPPVYIIEDEAINAFAAGHTPQDAVIGVTRGCIRVLNRDELQGVIAHEFSHIFHGDMKLNMRLVALLNGILLIGLIGEFLLRSSRHGRAFRSRKDQSAAAMMGIGLGLMIIGYAGTFFGKLIKAAVSRQREFLADASAVKFTRNPDGIGGALKKLGGYVGGSQMDVANAAEFSHMFFGEGANSLFSALATHPPLPERIKRIDPRWNGEFAHIDVYQPDENSYIEEGRLSEANEDHSPLEFSSPKNAMEFVVTVDQILQTIGQPNESHLAYAHQTLNAINDQLREAAHNPWDAQALMLGLLIDKNPDKQSIQWQALGKLFSQTQIHSIKPLALQASLLEPRLRLPLLELSLPALKNLSTQQYELFRSAMSHVIHADEHIDLIEWSFFKIITHNLEPKKSAHRLVDLTQLKNEACTLLSVIANAGANSASNAQAAFNKSKSIIGFDDLQLMNESDYNMMDLDLAINRLNCVKPLQKPKLLKAMSQCVLADQEITVVEAELFRAIADALDCPVPPLIVASH
ncbi:Zn-dependent protease [Cellvibrio zantedeschiae]|uniref:Zn-dependent protease n=1 Tax=Cellvibrio zantedeschiae TaxID=1237077 RepID=A0ABQ3ASG5_9GAMM|nr:M48 family metallopeptidase [Cellvibrio zantedeschiae]GGY62600.1 Zn-dependent protease [Cellvibrio zantedeschiae]